jgi:hypothetical protein
MGNRESIVYNGPEKYYKKISYKIKGLNIAKNMPFFNFLKLLHREAQVQI